MSGAGSLNELARGRLALGQYVSQDLTTWLRNLLIRICKGDSIQSDFRELKLDGIATEFRLGQLFSSAAVATRSIIPVTHQLRNGG